MARQEIFLTEIFVFKNKKHKSMNNKCLAVQLWHIKSQTFALCKLFTLREGQLILVCDDFSDRFGGNGYQLKWPDGVMMSGKGTSHAS